MQKINKGKRGFTLIELLVVIAIIGILSSVVLASLNSARGKGANAAIKSNLSNIRVQAEIYYDNVGGNYGTAAITFATTLVACSIANTMFDTAASPSVNPSIVAAESASDSSATWVATCGMTLTPAGWAVSVPLKVAEGTITHWCVDSSGASKGRTSVVTTITC